MPAEPTVPQWICEHCFIHLVNGDCTKPDTCHVGLQEWEVDGTDENDPLHLFGPMHVTPDTLQEDHSCGREDECNCETREFSWSACDGCGDPHGGARYAVTGWSM